MNLNVMVTGGTGFIGSHVLHQLLDDGHRAITYELFINNEQIVDVADRIAIVKGDVQDLPTIIETIKKYQVTHIVHTASLLTAESQRKPMTALKVNVDGTVNILEAARLMGVERVVYTSSTAVYGYAEEGKTIDENYPQRPVTIYGTTKLLCEHYGLNYNKEFGLDFAALRFPIVYGPGQSTRGFRSFKELIEKPLLGQPAKVDSGGDQEYDGVYVKDIANAIVAACETETKHKIFNIGTGEMHTLRDVAKIVKEIVPDATFKIGPGFDVAEPVKGPMSIERAKEELGYRPKYPLRKGVEDYIEVFKRMHKLN